MFHCCLLFCVALQSRRYEPFDLDLSDYFHIQKIKFKERSEEQKIRGHWGVVHLVRQQLVPLSGTSSVRTLRREVRKSEEEWGSWRWRWDPQTEVSLTLKVHLSVSVEVGILEDLVDLPVGHLLPHQLLHGLAQLRQADLTVAVGVKLGQEEERCAH